MYDPEAELGAKWAWVHSGNPDTWAHWI